MVLLNQLQIGVSTDLMLLLVFLKDTNDNYEVHGSSLQMALSADKCVWKMRPGRVSLYFPPSGCQQHLLEHVHGQACKLNAIQPRAQQGVGSI